jgi:hypothetical protein
MNKIIMSYEGGKSLNELFLPLNTPLFSDRPDEPRRIYRSSINVSVVSGGTGRKRRKRRDTEVRVFTYSRTPNISKDMLFNALDSLSSNLHKT